MKLFTKDFVVNEEEYIAYQMLQLIHEKYSQFIPEKSLHHLQQTLKYLIQDLEKEYPKRLDITNNELIERITFDEDTLKH